eukprot:jgi/Tetstr1/464573/TSEL_009329.t1
MIRASTELGNLRSQLKYLVKRAVGTEEAEQYWGAVVDKQKAVEKELRSLLAKEAKQREEDAILRRKKDKAISRLRAKVRQLYNCPEHADDASGDEVSSKSDSSGEEAAAYRWVRERPSGLVYKLREARNYATIRKHISRKVDMLDNWLTEIVGDDDSWKEMYTETVVESDSDSDSQAADNCDDASTAKKQKQPPPPQEWEQIEKKEDLVGQPAGIVYDDESVVGVKGKERLLVNSVENNLPCAFFLRDDCYEDVMKSLPTLPQHIDTLLAEGLMVDGKKHGVEVCMGGDLKLLNGWLGLCGCSSFYQCIYCMAPKGTLHRSKAAWAAHGGLPQRFIERMVELAHKSNPGFSQRPRSQYLTTRSSLSHG